MEFSLWGVPPSTPAVLILTVIRWTALYSATPKDWGYTVCKYYWITFFHGKIVKCNFFHGNYNWITFPYGNSIRLHSPMRIVSNYTMQRIYCWNTCYHESTIGLHYPLALLFNYIIPFGIMLHSLFQRKCYKITFSHWITIRFHFIKGILLDGKILVYG